MKKIYLNENHFKSFLNRMEKRGSYDDSQLIIRTLITEGPKKMRGVIKGFDEAIAVAAKSLDSDYVKEIIKPLEGVITRLDDGLFKPMSEFNIRTPDFSFVGSGVKQLDDYILKSKKVVEELLKDGDFALTEAGKNLTLEQARITEIMTRYKKSLSTLSEIDNAVKNGGEQIDALLNVFTREQGDLKKLDEMIKDLDLLTVPDVDTKQIDELGKYWEQVKNLGKFETSDDVIKWIDDNIVKYGFDFKKLPKSKRPLRLIKDKLGSKGLTLDDVILIKNGDELIIISGRNQKDLQKRTPKELRKYVDNFLKDNPTMKELPLTEITEGNKLLKWLKKLHFWQLLMGGFTTLVVGWGIGTALASALYCIFAAEDIDVFNKAKKEIEKRGGEVITSGWPTCFLVNFINWFLTPVLYFADKVEDGFVNLYQNLTGLIEHSILQKCSEEKLGTFEIVNGEKIEACDCKKMGEDWVASSEFTQFKETELFVQLTDMVNSASMAISEDERVRRIQNIKDALHEDKLPEWVYKDEKFDIKFDEMYESICLSLSRANRAANAGKLVKKYQNKDYLTSYDFCNVDDVITYYNDVYTLYEYAKDGIIFTSKEEGSADETIDRQFGDLGVRQLMSSSYVVIDPDGSGYDDFPGAKESAVDTYKIELETLIELKEALEDTTVDETTGKTFKETLCDTTTTTFEEDPPEVVITPEETLLNAWNASKENFDMDKCATCKINENEKYRFTNWLKSALNHNELDIAWDKDTMKKLMDDWFTRQVQRKTQLVSSGACADC
jgi:hypothetical protein